MIEDVDVASYDDTVDEVGRYLAKTGGHSVRDESIQSTRYKSRPPKWKIFSTAVSHNLAPRGAEIGDRVCIVLGYPASILIRQAPCGWYLVGECHVKEIMKGEALEWIDQSKLESQHTLAPLQDIEIH